MQLEGYVPKVSVQAAVRLPWAGGTASELVHRLTGRWSAWASPQGCSSRASPRLSDRAGQKPHYLPYPDPRSGIRPSVLQSMMQCGGAYTGCEDRTQQPQAILKAGCPQNLWLFLIVLNIIYKP